MFFAPSKSSGGIVEREDAFLDGSCWESARSSWIYMEMEPRQRQCNSSPTTEKCPEVRPSEKLKQLESPICDGSPVPDSSQNLEIVFKNASYQDLEEDGGQSIGCEASFRFDFTTISDASTGDYKWSSADTSRDQHVSDLEFVNGRTAAAEDIEEEQPDGEGDYEEIRNVDEQRDVEEHQYAILSNDNFVLQKDERHVRMDFTNIVDTSISEEDKVCRARRSVSLDLVRPPKLLMRHSETMQFSPLARVMSRALPPVPQSSALPAKPPTPPLSPVPNNDGSTQSIIPDAKKVSAPVRPAYLPWGDSDKVSLSTLGAFSTTTSGGSLYRIPAKVRKMSCSTSQTTNTSTTSSPGQASTCSMRTCDSSSPSTVSGGSASRVAVDVLNGVKRTSRPSSSTFTVAQLPRIIREIYSFLWSDNPDRDPFNTFSVSETDLTSAIAHLESQLSSSVRSCNNRQSNKTRDSLAWTEAPTKEKRPQSCQLDGLGTEGILSSSSSDSVPEDKDGPRVSDGAADHLPFRVQFIMESYCNIYMMR